MATTIRANNLANSVPTSTITTTTAATIFSMKSEKSHVSLITMKENQLRLGVARPSAPTAERLGPQSKI